MTKTCYDCSHVEYNGSNEPGEISGLSDESESHQATPKQELTDDQLADIWINRDCMDAIRAGDIRVQFICAARAAIAASAPNSLLVVALHKNAIQAVQDWVQAEYKSTKSLGRGGPSHEEELDRAERKARDAIAALASITTAPEA